MLGLAGGKVVTGSVPVPRIVQSKVGPVAVRTEMRPGLESKGGAVELNLREGGRRSSVLRQTVVLR